MKLSAPIYILKARAKELKRAGGINHAEALKRVAQEEGYSSWGLLVEKSRQNLPKDREGILGYLNPGDLFLIGARPGQGKTVLALQLLIQAAKEERPAYFFSLEYNHREVAEKLSQIDEGIGQYESGIQFDFSDEIEADSIIEKVKSFKSNGAFVVVDFLQSLDHERNKPTLQHQIEKMKSFAREEGSIFTFLSQLDRKVDLEPQRRPQRDDIRQVNPLDLSFFNKILLIHNKEAYFAVPKEFSLDCL